MPVNPRSPVIVGAGQVVQRPDAADPAADPITLATEALRAAGADSDTADELLRRADSVGHVATLSWPYHDEAALIAQALGVSPRETVRTALIGGDGPVRLLADAATAIAAGQVDVALISGAEAGASVVAAQRRGDEITWDRQPDDVRPSRVVGLDRPGSSEAELAVGLSAPIYNYALLETAVRRRLGNGPDEHMRALSAMWSRFSEVAASNPYAWLRQARSAEDLQTATPANRPVSLPYLKLLTANIQVNLASGLIVCSAEAARTAGVPRDRWVFVHSMGYAHDRWFLSQRGELAASPAIAAAGRAAFEHAGVGIDEIAHVDLYSCFPSAVEIAALELGLPTHDEGRPLTVTGGLTFAGGPGNNYASHGIATLVARLREDPSAFGLGTAVGWYSTKHAIAIYSTQPPESGFREIDAGPDLHQPPSRPARTDYEGPAEIESYTVPFDRDGQAEAAVVSALAPDGTRALLRSTDPELIDLFHRTDPLGWSVDVREGRLAVADQSSRS